MSAPLRLSVLDQSPIAAGSTPAQALRNSVDLACFAEELGYERYWVAEHHGTPALACASPPALIGPIASATKRIRVGSGGVMLPHYSPLHVAETFSMLAGLFPNRIDLGVGRAAGTDPTTTFALQRDRRQASPDDFPQQLVELMAYLDDDMPQDHPFARLTALPGRPEHPDLWLLGSSPQSGLWAAELGLPYAFADFINPQGAEIAQHYREHFTPARTLSEPRVIAAVWTLCAETEEEAQRLAASGRMMIALLQRGQLIPIPPPDVAQRFLEKEGVPLSRRLVLGTPDTIRTRLEAVAEEYGASELMIVTNTYDHAARRRSFELVAEAFRD
ncbi:MAG: LLM class flavin-dependent oxidoreductase [Acidobacteria bacterium]|nr:LLM class flavin-dependent oxidoreductase [Acidobacteriota bacterium]MBV9476603.1 LLM class flavin-dependent oxidoreductase [Acidobacteriota bacterium]